jgi:5-(carboxyamino)imidazole ribonucleotide synthase
MLNLLGDLWWRDGSERSPDWTALLALPGVHLHLYGKTEARHGRKMGHVTITAQDIEAARHVSAKAAALLGIPA